MTIGEGSPPPTLPPSQEMGGLEDPLLKLVQLLTQLSGGGSTLESNSLKIPIEGKIYVPQKARTELPVRQFIHVLPSIPQMQKQLEQAKMVVVGEGRGPEIRKPEPAPNPSFASKTSEKGQIAPPPRSENKQSSDMNHFSPFSEQTNTPSSLPKPLQKAAVDVKEVTRFFNFASSKPIHSSKPNLVSQEFTSFSAEKQSDLAKEGPELVKKMALEVQSSEKWGFSQESAIRPKLEQKTEIPSSFSERAPSLPSRLPPPQKGLPSQEFFNHETQASLGVRRMASGEGRGEQPYPASLKTPNIAPFQTLFTPRMHSLKKSKKTEKSLSWQEEEPEDQEEEKEE